MPDELQGRENNVGTEPDVPKFLNWVTGGSRYQAAVTHVADVAGRVIARDLCRRLGSDGARWYLALARISGIDHPELLKSILRESWDLLGPPASDVDDLGNSGIFSYENKVSGALVLLAVSISLGATGDPGNGYEGDIPAIREDQMYDPALPRQFFSWAKEEARASGKTPRRFTLQIEGQPGGGVIFRGERGSAELRAIYAILQITWNNPSGISLVQRLIGTVPSDRLTAAGAELFSTRMDFLAEIGKLDINEARIIGENPGVAEIAAKEIPEFNVTSNTRLDHESRRRSQHIYAALVDSKIYKVLPLLSMRNLERHPLLFGKAVALRLQVEGMQFSAETVGQLLMRAPGDIAHTVVCGIALLWADLAQLSDYLRGERWKHRDQIRGVLARLSRHHDSWPEAWAASAHDILGQAEAIGPDGLDLLAVAGARHPIVRDAMADIAHHDPNAAIRDRAAGMLARIDGVTAPGEGLSRWLADSAARAFDGTPVFPRPLSPLARTWIGSVEVEEIISRGIQQAMFRFSDWTRSQGAITEEFATGRLLAELETAFRDASMRTGAGIRAGQYQEISVSQRPVTKTEERQWGCDIALLLNAQIASTVKLRAAELIQVKKSQAFTDGPERWRIDIRQLAVLLKMSQSAGYWLILSTGEILCVTARWVHGLVEGRGALGQGSVTLGYNDLRHAAVPIGQYILEIFLGTWVGSIDSETVSFARGENSRLAPRYIFDVSITAGDDQQDQQ